MERREIGTEKKSQILGDFELDDFSGGINAVENFQEINYLLKTEHTTSTES